MTGSQPDQPHANGPSLPRRYKRPPSFWVKRMQGVFAREAFWAATMGKLEPSKPRMRKD